MRVRAHDSKKTAAPARFRRPQNFLYFVNCDPGAAVSFKARLSMYNLKPDGKRDYLSIGETELDTVYWVRAALVQRGNA